MANINFPHKKRLQLLWFSSMLFIFSALLIRLIVNLEEAVLMKSFRLVFNYQPFGNILKFDGISNWNDLQVIIVFSIGPLLSFLSGFILIRVLDKSKYLGWKLRLLLTWLAFVLIHLLPLGMLAGVLFSQDYEYASSNFFMTPGFRGGISAAMLVMAIYFRPLWLKLFSRSAYSHRIIDHNETFIKWVFIRSWGLGLLVLSFFASIGNYWSWLTQIALMGFVILPFFNWTTPKLKLRLTKLGGEEIFKYKITPYLYSALIIALLVLAQVLMNFLS